MGTRDGYETIAATMQAFAERNVWTQADLARRLKIGVPALRNVLKRLHSSGMPLHHEHDHPHVHWSVEKGWFPGGIIFDGKDWEVLVHAVLRLPGGSKRESLLRRLLGGRHAKRPAEGVECLQRAVASTQVRPEEHDMQLLLERSILEGRPLRTYYFSASSRRMSWRTLSPQRLFVETPNRFVAYCHTHRQLRWFRIDGISRADVSLSEERVDVPAHEVDAFVERSVDGFHDGTADELAFRVRDSSAAWVKQNLLRGMHAEDIEGGLRVTTRGAALVVARFVAGLGGDAVAEGEKLRALVRELAERAQRANE